MCGICGVVIGPRSSRSVDETTLVRMRDVLAHRGPDGSGLHIGRGVGLGHRRLSIIDVAGGAQPMYTAGKQVAIVYNGEVFNHPALKAGLEAQGAVYRTRCDTETVLKLYESEGRHAPKRLRGMFAFAIWDERTRSLLLARDRFGVKPLYYHLAADGTLVFGSEIKSLLASGILRAALREEGLPDYLANHATSGDETLFAGVRRVPPGHTLVWHDGRVSLERYWDLSYRAHVEPGADGISDAAHIDEFRDRFREAVKLRLMSDVPLGMFLSGGIDSAAITAMMSQLVRDPIKTFSVAFAEREANELEYARLVATRYGTDHHEVVVSAPDFLDAIPKLVWHEDEPMAHPSSVALYFVSRLAAQHVKVVLTGEGSDEMLAGYNRYRVTLLNLRYGVRYQQALPAGARRLIGSALAALAPGARWRARLRRTFLFEPATLEHLYFDNFAVFGRLRQASLLAAGLRERVGMVDPYEAAQRALRETDACRLLDRLLYADVRTYMHELLMKQDQMSMAASIESRVPFLDHPLAEYVARLPQRMKLRGLTTKHILRRAMEGLLPDRILTRRKMGFPVPFGGWVAGAHGGVLDEFVLGARARDRGLFDAAALAHLVAEHRAGANHDERMWSLVNLELWQRIFLDGEDPASIRLAAPVAAHPA
jgi:asparagine synthase (glutamine-hydrolysing)